MIILLITFALCENNLAQTLIKTFDYSQSQMVNDSVIIMACNECENQTDHTIVIVHKNEGNWDIEESFTPTDYVSNMMSIANIKASADGLTISVSLINTEDNIDNNQLDDALLVFRRIDNNWHLVFRLENITISTLYGTDRVVTDFSDNGDIFVLSSNNYFNDFQVEPLLTKIYNYVNGEYILTAHFTESEWYGDRLFLNLLKDNETIILSQVKVYNWTNKRFAQYNLLDNVWQRGDSFGEKEEEDITSNFLVSNKDVSSLVTCKTDLNLVKVFNPQIEIFQQDDFGAWIITSDSYEIDDNYEIINLDISNSGNIIALTADHHFSLKDTLAFVDYLKFDSEEFIRLFRLSYKYPDPIDKYGLTGMIDVSPDGRYLLVQKWPQTLLYDMASLLGLDTKSFDNFTDCVSFGGRIFPKPTLGSLETKNINFNQVQIINSLGQHIATQQAGNLSLLDYSKGIYHLIFELDGNFVCNTTIINQ
jgi:hypothetical protein